MRLIILTALIFLGAIPANALDVSVGADGRARVSSIVKSIGNKLDIIDVKVVNNTQNVQTANDEIAKVKSCGDQNKILKNGVCVSPPPDITKISTELGCADGDIIMKKNGNLVCRTLYEDCKVCYKYKVIATSKYAANSSGGDGDEKCTNGYGFISTLNYDSCIKKVSNDEATNEYNHCENVGEYNILQLSSAIDKSKNGTLISRTDSSTKFFSLTSERAYYLSEGFKSAGSNRIYKSFTEKKLKLIDSSLTCN